MKNITERLDKLICSTLNPNHLKDITVTERTIQQWILDAKTEKENIRLQLIQHGFHVNDEKGLLIFVQSCQVTATHYIDVLVSHNHALAFSSLPQRKQQLIATCYKGILELLEELLSFLEQHFPNYFNQHEKVPNSYLLISQIDIRQQLKQVKKLFDRKELPKELVSIVLSPIARFAGNNSSEKYTYLQLMYIKLLINELKEYGNSPNNDYASLLHVLLFMNFNDLQLANYCLKLLQKQVDGFEETAAKLEHYSLYLKEISQVFRKPNIFLHEDLPTLYELLCGWIEEEKTFLQTKVPRSVVDEQKTETEMLEEELIKLSLSSPQLALLIRCLKETGVIENRNKSLMLRTISRIVKTMRSEKDLSNALQSEYYKATKDIVTIRKVKDIVINLLNYLLKLEKENK